MSSLREFANTFSTTINERTRLALFKRKVCWISVYENRCLMTMRNTHILHFDETSYWTVVTLLQSSPSQSNSICNPSPSYTDLKHVNSSNSNHFSLLYSISWSDISWWTQYATPNRDSLSRNWLCYLSKGKASVPYLLPLLYVNPIHMELV